MKEKNDEKKSVVLKYGSSPAEMIRMAVSGGADLEKLEKLLALQEKWEANEARKLYHRAMASFKETPLKIMKDKKVKYLQVQYSHASLANVVDQITKELSKNGLSASWNTKQNGAITVTCKITHVMGHCEETTLTAAADTSGSKNSIQAIGSTITYLQRYTLLSALGLATHDQDNDGAGATEYIDEKQMHLIRDQLIDLEKDEKKFLAYMGIESLDKIPKSEFNKAQTALEASRAKKAK